MRYLSMVACCFLFMLNCCGAADDKVLHFVISGACGAGCETVLHYETKMETVSRVLLATAVGSLPGLAKEIKDSGEPGNEFGVGDMTADVLGALTGAFLSSRINDALEIRLQAGRKGGAVTMAWCF